MYDRTPGTNMMTTPNEDGLNRRRYEGRLLVRIENSQRNRDRVSYGKYTYEHYVDEFGPVDMNLKA